MKNSFKEVIKTLEIQELTIIKHRLGFISYATILRSGYVVFNDKGTQPPEQTVSKFL